MTEEPTAYFVFVDFENVPEIDLALVTGRPAHVVLLLGRHQKKLDVGLVQQIRRQAVQVELIEVGASGHNALDLTLAFYLGQAVTRAPAAHFCIVSKDKDFEPMIEHLRGQRIKVARYASFGALPFLPAPKPAAIPARRPVDRAGPAEPRPSARDVHRGKPGTPPADRRSKVIARLSSASTRNRPSSEKALLAHLKTALGKESSEAGVAEILREMVAAGIVSIDANGRVLYPANASG